MNRKIMCMGIVSMFILLSLTTLSVSAIETEITTKTGKTIYVDDDWEDDPDNHKWNTIQEGIDDAKDGDTVYVYSGTYEENIDIKHKSSNLIGETEEYPLIKGSLSLSKCKTSKVEGFKFHYEGTNYCITLSESQDCKFINNIVETDGEDAIEVESMGLISEKSLRNVISGNTITDKSQYHSIISIRLGYKSGSTTVSNNKITGGSIIIFSSDNRILNNNLIDCSDSSAIGVYKGLTSVENNWIYENTIEIPSYYVVGIDIGSDNNKIYDNTILCVGEDEYSHGILIGYCNENEVYKNDITDAKYAIAFYSDYQYCNSKNEIYRNTISHCNKGLYLYGENTKDNIIRNNKVKNNEYGIYIPDCSVDGFAQNNYIYCNSFKENEFNVCDANNLENGHGINKNKYYSSDLMKGNYWDDYKGSDKDGDGIGDTPYIIPDGDSDSTNNIEDIYPLMKEESGGKSKPVNQNLIRVLISKFLQTITKFLYGLPFIQTLLK